MRISQLKKGLKVNVKTKNQTLVVMDWNEACVLLKTEEGRALSHRYGDKFLQYDHTYLPMSFVEWFLEVKE